MSSPLRGGRHRRRVGPILLVLVVLVSAAALVAGGYFYAVSDDDGRGATPEIVHTPSVDAGGGSLEARSPVPIHLTGGNAFSLHFAKPPRSALVFDVDDGRVLFRRDPERVLPIASLTKIMTALAVVEEAKPDEKVKITPDALHYSGSGVGVLPKGKNVRLESLLNGLLIVSGNDAAIALADHISGTRKRFVALMNEKARLWGLRCTHYVSPHGLEKGNRSCAADLAVMTRLAMRNPRITRIVRRRQAVFPFPIKGGKLYLYGHNPLLRANYPGTIGLKTGFTDDAGRCFVGVVRRHGVTLGVVLLNSPNPVAHAEKLLDLGFRSGVR
jgi:serine-type D-Ala-D-Ala carboxypeptidase (penicillin-binding protein 5/6)